jgi:choline-sulfatase
MANARRNILLLCTDQFRGDMFAANGLNPDIRTPHMDDLAARGTLFRRHFTTFPKCVPARVSMMTGRYTHTDGYRDITRHMPAGTPDLASTLKAAGYELVEFGRNHCWENMLAATHRPSQLKQDQKGLAFDHHAWTPPFDDVWDRHKLRGKRVERVEPATLSEGRGLVFADDRNWFTDEAVTEMAELFLTEVRDADRPFFCQVNLGKPHTPYETGEPWFGMYPRAEMLKLPRNLPENAPICARRQREVRTGVDCPEGAFDAIQSTYMAMCSRVDELLGRVVAALERSGSWDDTVIVFTSDHGDYAGQYGLPEKWDNHFPDALMHVPMAIVGRGVAAGETVDALTDHTDLAPTLCDLAGVERFEGIHGRSMLNGGRAAVFGNGGHEAAIRGRFNFYDHSRHKEPADATAPLDVGLGKQEVYRRYPESMARAKMVRTERWKLVHRETGDHELYDLAADRFEMRNLYPEPGHEAVKLDLMAKLLDWTLLTDPDRPALATVGA